MNRDSFHTPDDHSSYDLVVRVISLPSASVRRKSVLSNLEKLRNVPWSFFDALTEESNEGPRTDEIAQRARFGRTLTSGEIGCFKSHFAVIDEFCKSPSGKWLLVLEDDVFLDVNFDLARIVAVLASMHIGYLRLYSRRLKPFSVVRQVDERQIVRYASDPYGAQAYLISKSAARRFLDSFETITMPIDDEMGRFWVNGLELFALFPYPVLELSGSSSLESQRIAQEAGRRKNSPSLLWFRVNEKLRKINANLRYRLSKSR